MRGRIGCVGDPLTSTLGKLGPVLASGVIDADVLRSVRIRDVTLRDGLQLTSKRYPTDLKVKLVRTLLGLGFTDIEVGSFARPDLVPALADTPDVLGLLDEAELARVWVWVATPRHLAMAIQQGVRRAQFCVSVSESHNRANLGRPRDVSIEAVAAAADMASPGFGLQLCLATAFSCPFEGITDPQRVLDIVEEVGDLTGGGIVLCDTLGEARPAQVYQLVAAVRALQPDRPVVFHGHDTWGSGVANTVAAISAGAQMVDAAIGGLGGCPFAPGASGNVATEDLVYALQPDWLPPDAVDQLAHLSHAVLGRLGEPIRSHVAPLIKTADPTTEPAPTDVPAKTPPRAGTEGSQRK